MRIPCTSGCRRLFGGVVSFDRHWLRREDRCKTDGELRAAGYYTDAAGVWHRPSAAAKPKQAHLVDRRTVAKVPRKRVGRKLGATQGPRAEGHDLQAQLPGIVGAAA